MTTLADHLSGEKYLAFDVGAESGRVILGALDGEHLELREIKRFANAPVRVLDSLYWDILRIWKELKDGLIKVSVEHGSDLDGIAVDTWALDFGLLDRNGALLGLPYSYRDSRTEGILEELRKTISEVDLYKRTGLFHLSVSTLCQLLAMKRDNSPALNSARTFLLLPNLLTYWLCGRQAAEITIAGNTQFFNLVNNDWDYSLLEMLKLPTHMLPEVLPSATVLGNLLPWIGKEASLGSVPIIASACHDTAAAVASIPSLQDGFTFISSGTWSVIGTELDTPILSEAAIEKQFLNEMGACGKIFFAHNSIGLWAAQECRREWARAGHELTYQTLTDMAVCASPFAVVINPDASSFFHPGNMTDKIAAFCRNTMQTPPETPGDIFRSLLEGLALRYRKAIEDLDSLTGKTTQIIHLVGGGSQNHLLCQFTADATGCQVIAGPAEATATATILLQALAHKRIASLYDLRQVVRNSFELITYEPNPSEQWHVAYNHFRDFHPTLL
jgi:rhamnulokinase